MKEEIRQDGRTILSSEDGFSIRMFFNNLSGKNFSGKEYRDYVRNIAFGEMGFRPGTIELYCDGEESQDRHTSRTLNSSQGQKSNFVRITYKREPKRFRLKE